MAPEYASGNARHPLKPTTTCSVSQLHALAPQSISLHPLLVAICLLSVNCNSYTAVSSFRGHRNLFSPTIYTHCTASFFRHSHGSSHYAWVDFTIVQNDAPLTSSAAFDVLYELRSTRFGWIRTVLCYRLSCSGLRRTGLLGGCRPSRRSFLRSDVSLFS